MPRPSQQWLAGLKLLARAQVRDDAVIDVRVGGRRGNAGYGPLQGAFELPAISLRPVDVDVFGNPVTRHTAAKRDLIEIVVIEVDNASQESLAVESGFDADVAGAGALHFQIRRGIGEGAAEPFREGRRLDALADVAEHLE